MKLYVSNLASLTSIEDLETMFADFGEIVAVSLNETPDPGKDTFTAWIEMEYEDEAEEALADLNGERIDGNAIRVLLESDYEAQHASSPITPPIIPNEEEEEEGAPTPTWQPIERKRPARWKRS
jgi:RNA recognition motif-containing protein